MSLDFRTLVVPPTEADTEETALAVLQLAGFPVTSWASGSVPKRLVKAFAPLITQIGLTIAFFALGSFVETATGAWLTLLASSFYQITRSSATFAVHTVRMTNASGAPIGIVVGQYIARSDGGLFFRNTDDGGAATIADGAFADVEFTAEVAGTTYNVSVGTITALTVDVPGLTISNLAIGATGSSLTDSAADAQSDDSLRLACQSQWATLGTGSPQAAYVNWVLVAVPTVTRVKVRADNPGGPGSVGLYLANSAGGASAAEMSDAVTAVDLKVPAGSSVEILAAVNLPIALTQTIRVRAAYLVAAQAEVSANFIALSAATQIGGDTDSELRIYGQIIDRNLMVEGVLNALPNASDVVLGVAEVPVFNISGLTWVSV